MNSHWHKRISQGALALVASLALAMSSSKLSTVVSAASPTFKIRYDASKLKVNFGENFKMNLWTQVEKGSLGNLNWSIKAGGLPEGLTLLVTSPQSASISGRVQFLGQWCVQVSAIPQGLESGSLETFCIESKNKEKSPVISPSDELNKKASGKLDLKLGVSSGVTS